MLVPVSDTNEVDNGLKKPEISKNPRYIDTRMDEVFPVKKSRVRMLSGKENAKVNTFPCVCDLLLRNAKFTTFSQQILSGRLLPVGQKVISAVVSS